MAAIDISTGFHISAPVGIDDRLVLTKEEMLNMNDGLMPDSYFALCSEDNKLYVYNKSNTPNKDTGKFSPLISSSKSNVTIDDLSELLGKPAESHVVTEEESNDEESKYFGKEVGSIVDEPATGAYEYIDKTVSKEIDEVNSQTTISTYITVEMENETNGTIVATDVVVLQPKSSVLNKDTTWFDTSKTSFTLSEPEQILGLADLVSSGEEDFIGKTIVLSGDINLQGQEFRPIGDVQLNDPTKSIYSQTNTGNGFQGTFDGNGHTISNIRITKPSGASWNNTGIGLFGLVTGETTIKNLTINNIDIEAPTSNMVGTVVGYAARTSSEKVATIENVNISGNIRVSGNIGVGAIVGRTEVGNKLIMRNCSVIGNDPNTSIIEGTYKNAFAGVGGLIGACYGNAENEISNCIVKNVTIKAPDEGVGGLVGHFERGTISNNTIQNVRVIDSINTDLYMQEAVSVGAIAGTIDSTIKATSGSARVKLSGNMIRNVEVHISSTYTNTGNASGVSLNEDGYPDWEAWSVLGTPRNVEYRNVTDFAIADNPTWSEMRNNITVIKD